MGTALTITDKATAGAFAAPKTRAILFALMQAERSSQDLADHLGLSLSLLHYHLRKLQRVGLIKIARRVARSGRSITIYAAAAESFIVRAKLDQAPHSAQRHAELRASLKRARERRPEAASLYDLGEGALPRMRRMDANGPAPTEGEWWWRLNLTNREAQRLGSEIREVFTRYGRRPRSSGKAFIAYVAWAKA